MLHLSKLVPWILTVWTVVIVSPPASEARLAGNRLAGNRLAGNRLASNRLAGNALATNSLEAHESAAELLSTPEGRDVFSYIVSCALPGDVTITATVEGTTYEFPGGVGLAPRWLEKKLNKKGQHWVSACLLARVNDHDTAEAVSMRGKHEALTPTEEEAVLYTLEEGTFYGQLFSDDAAIPWFACRGEAQASTEEAGLVLRDCAEPESGDPTLTRCGFNYTGDCADYGPETPGTPYACKSFDDETTSYETCHDREGAGKWPRAKKFKQVITVYVSN
jgi:hypothetical protein